MKEGTTRGFHLSHTAAVALLLVITLAPTDLRAEREDSVAQPGCQLVIELENGSRFVGTPKEPTLSLKTEFAIFTIPLNRVTTFSQETDGRRIVTLINGDHVSGQFSRESFRVTTEIGEVVIPLSLIKNGRTLSNGETVGDSRWSKAVGGLSCRLRSTANTVTQHGRLRMILEIKNTSTKAINFPYPTVDECIADSIKEQRNANQAGYVIRLRSRPIKQEDRMIVQEIIECGLVQMLLDSQDIDLEPDEVITIKLKVQIMMGEMAMELRDFEQFDLHERPVVIRERLNWSLNGLGTYGLHAVIERPHSEKVRKGAKMTTWNGPLLSPELVVEVTK